MGKKQTLRICLRRDYESVWEENNPILLNGELIVSWQENGSGLFKLGDGVRKYTDLPFVSVSDAIESGYAKIYARNRNNDVVFEGRLEPPRPSLPDTDLYDSGIDPKDIDVIMGW